MRNQNNVTMPSSFKRNPLLRRLGATMLGVAVGTTGYAVTDYVDGGNQARDHREAATQLLAEIGAEDTKMLLNNIETTKGEAGNQLELRVRENNLSHSQNLNKRRERTIALMSSIVKDEKEFSYVGLGVGVITGLITALVAGKKLKAEDMLSNFPELCDALVQTSRDGEFRADEGKIYKIDFKSLFTNTILELIKDPISKNKGVRLAFLEHKNSFIRMLRNLALQGRTDDAKLIVQNRLTLGISKADVRTVLEDVKLPPNDGYPLSNLSVGQRSDFIDSISTLLKSMPDEI